MRSYPGGLALNSSVADWSIETQRLLLRRVVLDDAAFMLSIWNDPAFIRHVGDRGIRTVAEAEAALTEGVFTLYEEFGYGPYCMVLKDGGMLAGICGLFRRKYLQHPDIGFAVLPEFYRAGLTMEAARAVVEHARNDLGIDYLTAIVSPNNTASIGRIEKLGLSFDRGITIQDEEEISLYGMRLD